MDLQAIEARLRANEAGRDGELYEHVPEDIRALLAEVKAVREAIARHPDVLECAAGDGFRVLILGGGE